MEFMKKLRTRIEVISKMALLAYCILILINLFGRNVNGRVIEDLVNSSYADSGHLIKNRNVILNGADSFLQRSINTGRCSYNHRHTDWATAVRNCETENKRLLCYESKSQIENITENLGLANNPNLNLWMYNRDCTSNQIEEFSTLQIRNTEEKFSQNRYQNCNQKHPSVCCVKGTGKCSFNHKFTDWKTAVRTCETENKQLLCYESKSQIENITEDLGLADFLDLKLWTYNHYYSDCKRGDECAYLTIQKTEKIISHELLSVYDGSRFPSICCGTGTDVCSRKCGEHSSVKCSGEQTTEDNTICGCEDGKNVYVEGKRYCRSRCSKKCGEHSSIRCSGDQTTENNTICGCADKKLFYDEGICKFCIEMCGEDPRIKCRIDETAAATCDCSFEKLYYDEKSKSCKSRCSKKCGEHPSIKCSGEQTAEDNTVCGCASEKYYYDKGACRAACEFGTDCGEREVCNDKNMCVCQEGYEGEDCEVITGCKLGLEEKCQKADATCVLDVTEPNKATCRCNQQGHIYDSYSNGCKPTTASKLPTTTASSSSTSTSTEIPPRTKSPSSTPLTTDFTYSTTTSTIPPSTLEDTVCDDARIIRRCARMRATCVVDSFEVEGYRCICKEGLIMKNRICSEKTVCDDARIIRKCIQMGATCVIDQISVDGYRCICKDGFLQKNGICTQKTACDDVRIIQKCIQMGATCVIDQISVDGYRCICKDGFFLKNGICTLSDITDNDGHRKIVIPFLIVGALFLIFFSVFCWCSGFYISKFNQKLKCIPNSHSGAK